MRYFSKSEFRGWYDLMDPEFLQVMDEFRHRLGYAVPFSPASGAIGRHNGYSRSRHNVDRYGVVLATDVMPVKHEPERWIRIAKEVGFTGIGYYPDWQPRPGLHLDTREPINKRIATWGALRKHGRQTYVSLDKALQVGKRRIIYGK